MAVTEEDIYELIDPRDKKIRYVGRSINGKRRWRQHLSSGVSSPSNNELVGWLRDLKRLKLKPILVVVKRVPKDCAATAEQEWIEKRLSEGCELYNVQYTGKLPRSSVRSDGVFDSHYKISSRKTVTDSVERGKRLQQVYAFFERKVSEG